MTDQIDAEQMIGIDRDAANYYEAAERVREKFDFHSYGVLMFGPGYPTFLAAGSLLVSAHPVALMIVQILLSAVGSVLLFLLAQRLTGDLRLGVIGGLINATSIESITLANILFSETLFFVLMMAGLLALLRGLERRRWPYFVISGLLLGLSALTRSAGQFLFVIVLFVSLVILWRSGRPGSRELLSRMKWPLATAGLIVVMAAAWILRNDHYYGLSHLSLAGPGGMAHLVRLTTAKRDSISFGESYDQFVREAEKRRIGAAADSIDVSAYRPYLPQPSVTDPETIAYNQAFVQHARESLWRLIADYPWLTLKVYLENVRHNIHTDWGKQYYYLPEWDGTLRAFTSWTDKKGLNYRLSLLALIGVVILVRRRNYRLLIILLALYGYFALLSGFSVFQGSRVFYPAQAAWAVLVAYPLLFVLDWLVKMLRKAGVAWGLLRVSS